MQSFFSCSSVTKLLPKGKVLGKKERTKLESQKNTQIQYSDKSKYDFPLIPLQIWAATYDLDIVIVSDHPKWNMHELARLQTAEGPIWIMKDARNGSLEQTITADIKNIENWLPEIPVKRKSFPVKVIDKSDDKKLYLYFEYENQDNELCKIQYEGPYPTQLQSKRNGSTMGHSRDQLIAVLDLPYRNFGKKAKISFDGKDYNIKKILGLLPFQMALKQTQAGISIGNFSWQKSGEKIISTHHKEIGDIVQEWSLENIGNAKILKQNNALRTIFYQFNFENELKKAWVELKYPLHKAFEISFFPPLPDCSRTFEGSFKSNFVMDVNGQKSHAIGHIECSSDVEKANLKIVPEKPWWVKDRPMMVEIEKGAEVRIRIERVKVATD
jgi:hypothetical protein